MQIVEGRLDDPRVIELLHLHTTRARQETAIGSAHALDLDALRVPEIRFWSVWECETLVGIGALKLIETDHGEIKSMHVSEKARNRGIGGALLEHIITNARESGLKRLSLETGAWPYFAAARRLYTRFGFVDCPPFGDYRVDRNSRFMTLVL